MLPRQILRNGPLMRQAKALKEPFAAYDRGLSFTTHLSKDDATHKADPNSPVKGVQSGQAPKHTTVTTPSSAGQPPKKRVDLTDEEIREKMAELAGDGGASGVEYEDGKPVAMKRGVRDNMFRYI